MQHNDDYNNRRIAFQVVIKSSKTAKKAFVYKFLGPEITNSLISGYGPKHRAHRKLLIPIISGEYLDDYMQVMNIQLRRSVDIMAEKVGLKEFDIHDETEYCLADIANEIIYGIPGVSEEQGVKLISFDPIISLDIFFHRIISPWLHPSFLFNLSNSGRKWSTIMKKTRNMMIKIVNEKRKLYEALARNEPDIKKPKPSMLDLLMEHVVKTNVMNDKEIISEANTLFLGFFDTVLGVYAFVMLMLAMYPKEQEKVREEIITVFGIDRDVMREDLKKLKYLDMVIKEVLRLFPAGPFLPREVTDDLELDEYTLPKGAMIIMMPILTHRSEEYWDKPDCFIPERFLPENSKDRHPFAFIPFSCGPRSCPGSKFGLACLKVMIVHFIRKYQLSTTMECNDCQMIELGKKYPTNRLWLGSRLIVMKSSKTSKKSFVYKFMEPAITNSLMNGEGPKMRAHRKLLIPIINADLGEFDICHEAEYCLADIAYEVLFGIPGVAQDHGNLFIPHTIIDSLGILYHRVISPWLYPSFLFNLSKSGKIWHDNTKIVQDFFSKIINEKKKIYTELANNEPELEELKPSILDLLMAHVIKTNEMNDLEIKTEMITLFIGFYDTVLNLYSFMMLMLAMHIEEQEKVRREIITIFGTDGDVMEEDLGKLKYTEMVIKEVIRLFPVGPFLSREATDDLKLDEYTLPKGATVCMMPILTHRLEEHWDKPDFFIPERFLPENSKNRHPFAFIPFSGGSRSCPGSKFGMACLKVMTVHFIRKYQLRTTMKFNKLKLETHLSVRSVNGYKVTIEKINP
ncbi:hypothetical protein PV328_009874 [Microctonus aethiopoides]|uniref:Cytochrome P450 n=1 Tax=Microctonus aethiopoides TaxID=144406 RepID=A0AA39EY24_9HYME|nr:hypothetical protein PV328_009874 [Microctonus aethiopoides]